MKTITVRAEIEQFDAVSEFVEAELEVGGCPYATQMQMSLALDELFTNVASYAYGESGGDVEIGCSVEDGCAILVISDSGVQYNPLDKADPDVTLSAEERQIGGLGIFMVKKLMDSVEYEYSDGRNILTVKKKI